MPGVGVSLPAESLVVASALSVQVAAGFATRLLRTYGSMPVVALRVASSAIFLLILARPRWRPIPAAAWRQALFLGVDLALMNSVFYFALGRIPLGVAVTLDFCGPLGVAVLGSRRPRDLLWVAFAGLGVYVLAGGLSGTADMLGVVAALTAGLLWGIYIPVAARLTVVWPGNDGLAVSMLIAAAIVVPAAFLLADMGPVLSDPAVLAAGALVGLFTSAIPYTLELEALRRIPTSTFGVLMSLEPAIAAVVGFVILGQSLAALEVAAIGLVIAASVGASLSARSLEIVPGELEATGA